MIEVAIGSIPPRKKNIIPYKRINMYNESVNLRVKDIKKLVEISIVTNLSLFTLSPKRLMVSPAIAVANPAAPLIMPVSLAAPSVLFKVD